VRYISPGVIYFWEDGLNIIWWIRVIVRRATLDCVPAFAGIKRQNKSKVAQQTQAITTKLKVTLH
jgi:hypothetical protein